MADFIAETKKETEEGQILELGTSHVEAFLDATEVSRANSERDRDYRDHKQWTEDETQELETREQKAIVINRIQPKVDALIGVEAQRRTAPKALPRTFNHEKGADAATDALRFVMDNNDFQDTISADVFENMVVEGYGGCIIEMEKVGKKREVRIREIPWDRIYYDPHSRKRDFTDAKYKGIQMWMDKDDAKDQFPEMSSAIKLLFQEQTDTDGTTFADRPDWVEHGRKRIRVAQEYFKRNGKWHVMFFTRGLVLKKPELSKFEDENGDPDCPIEIESVYVDRDNNRYGLVRAWIGPQDEINHRRSKALYMLSSRGVVADRGAVQDRQATKEELRKAQSYVEVNPNARFEIHDNNDMGQAQFALLEEAKSEIDTIGINPELAGRGPQDASGRALIARQQGGMTEILLIMNRHTAWKKRVYRQCWNRIRQFWTDQRWLRVTDDPRAQRWVGLNIPVTAIEDRLMEVTGMTIDQLQSEFGEEIQQAIELRPEAGEVIRTMNQVQELDVDILIEETPDIATIQQEQFEVISGLAEQYGPQEVPFEAVLRLSSMSKKDEVLEIIQGDDEEKAQQAEQAQQERQMQVEGILAETELKTQSAADKEASAKLKDTQARALAGEFLRGDKAQQAEQPEQPDPAAEEMSQLELEIKASQKEKAEVETQIAKERLEKERVQRRAQELENAAIERELRNGADNTQRPN